MILDYRTYKDKVRGCWLGKNIGGTLGTPYEGKRGVFNVTGYSHNIAEGSLPNDDLDLQLVFLCAAEEWGRKVDAKILGEYWIQSIVGNWSEYGMCKNNMRNGILPPASGHFLNPYGNSCGCFIRSEIWACLAPGHPEIAVKYALEDAMVDHTDEGLYGEIFVAALEAAAFVEKDREKLIEIAFSYIPEDCAIAKAIKLVAECYRSGKTWRQARATLLNTYPDAFCFTIMDDIAPEDACPVGEPGYDAPANVAIAMLGWYYGEGDFGKSLCVAASCGEDADCTCATLGSIFGILHGASAIPEEWIKPIGEDIKTISLDLTDCNVKICKNITELTDRVTKLMPVFLGNNIVYTEDGAVTIACDESSLFDKPLKVNGSVPAKWTFRDELAHRMHYTLKEENAIYNAFIDYNGSIEISEGEEKEIAIKTFNKFGRMYWADINVFAPAEWEVLPVRSPQIMIDTRKKQWHDVKSIKLVPHGLTKGIYRFPIEVKIVDHPTSTYLTATFVVK
ncbi:MAG: ADP-ribosylglycohydrolase family protein [Clostridia bacterium]|nr:ADP-ribosylglycohydrolase family protein [Clostridia bacterium]